MDLDHCTFFHLWYVLHLFFNYQFNLFRFQCGLQLRFKRVACHSNAPYIIDYTCSIKAYSRTLTVLNMSIFVTKKWEDMFVS